MGFQETKNRFGRVQSVKAEAVAEPPVVWPELEPASSSSAAAPGWTSSCNGSAGPGLRGCHNATIGEAEGGARQICRKYMQEKHHRQ